MPLNRLEVRPTQYPESPVSKHHCISVCQFVCLYAIIDIKQYLEIRIQVMFLYLLQYSYYAMYHGPSILHLEMKEIKVFFACE